MKKLFFGALLVLSIPCFSQTFSPRADFPGSGRFGAVRFVINDIVYVGLGEAGAGVYPKNFYKFDPALNQWTPIADFPGAGRETGIAYSVNGKGYVGLGVAFDNTGTTVFNDFWRYDPTNNTWNQLGDFEGGARSKAAVYVLNGSAYVGTGANDQFVFLSDWWKYDPSTDNWTIQNNLGNLPPRYGAVAVVADNKAYLVGGRGNGSAFFAEIHEFNPNNAAGGWVLKTTDAANLSFVSAAAFALNNKIYLCYGLNAGFVSSYDPATNIVHNLGDLLELGEPIRYSPITYATSTGKGYLGLGYTSVVANQASAYKKDFWQFSVSTTPGNELQAEAPASIITTGENGVFMLDFTGSLPAGGVDLHVFDANGRLLQAFSKVHDSQLIDLSLFAAGMYYIRIVSSKYFWTTPLVKS